MELLSGIYALPHGLRFVATVGVFDGLHLGHAAVLRATTRLGERLRAAPVIITFDPHPDAVLRDAAPPLLCDPEERLARIAEAGIELTVVQSFDHSFAALSAEQFLGRLVAGRSLLGLVMSAESAFGRDRQGTAQFCRSLSRSLGFEVLEVPPVVRAGGRVSSTRIRGLIGAGRLRDAAGLLGRRYAVVGEVVHGDGRGRALGYPTANLSFPGPVALPPDGIYAVRASWGGAHPLAPARTADGVASLGVRPTFGGGGTRVLEVYLLDFDEDIYGERLRVTFLRRQRGERRFRDAAALVAQMAADTKRARAILARVGASADGRSLP